MSDPRGLEPDQINNNLPDDPDIEECFHVCSGNCRREGCNCNCGEYHEVVEEIPQFRGTREQLNNL